MGLPEHNLIAQAEEARDRLPSRRRAVLPRTRVANIGLRFGLKRLKARILLNYKPANPTSGRP